MNILVLLKNGEEKVGFRPLLSAFNLATFTSTPKEWTEELQKAIPYNVFILDELAGQTKELLQLIRSKSPNKSLLILILMTETDISGKEISLSDRAQELAEFGAELFLYRPFSLKDFKDIVETAVTWTTSPPPWVQLMRSGRALMQIKEYDRTVHSLDKLHSLMKDNLNIGLLLAKSLLQGDKEKIGRAVTVLLNLEAKHPESLKCKNCLEECYLKLGLGLEAFHVALRRFAIRNSQENLLTAFNYANKLPALQTWPAVLDCLIAIGRTTTLTARAEALQHFCHRLKVVDVETLASFLRSLKQNIDLLPNFKQSLNGLWTAAKQNRANSKDPQAAESYASCMLEILELMAEIEPHSVEIFECFIDLQLQLKNRSAIETKLRSLQQSGRCGIEFHICHARYALFIKDYELARSSLLLASSSPGFDRRAADVSSLQKQLEAAESKQVTKKAS